MQIVIVLFQLFIFVMMAILGGWTYDIMATSRPGLALWLGLTVLLLFAADYFIFRTNAHFYLPAMIAEASRRRMAKRN